MDDEDLRESIYSQILLNIDFLLTAWAFEASIAKWLAFDELLETLREVDTTQISDSLAWDLNTQVHEVIECQVLEPTAQALGAVDQLTLKEICHYWVIRTSIVICPSLTLLGDWLAIKLEFFVLWLVFDSIEFIVHSVDHEPQELLRVMLLISRELCTSSGHSWLDSRRSHRAPISSYTFLEKISKGLSYWGRPVMILLWKDIDEVVSQTVTSHDWL